MDRLYNQLAHIENYKLDSIKVDSQSDSVTFTYESILKQTKIYGYIDNTRISLEAKLDNIYKNVDIIKILPHITEIQDEIAERKLDMELNGEILKLSYKLPLPIPDKIEDRKLYYIDNIIAELDRYLYALVYYSSTSIDEESEPNYDNDPWYYPSIIYNKDKDAYLYVHNINYKFNDINTGQMNNHRSRLLKYNTDKGLIDMSHNISGLGKRERTDIEKYFNLTTNMLSFLELLGEIRVNNTYKIYYTGCNKIGKPNVFIISKNKDDIALGTLENDKFMFNNTISPAFDFNILVEIA